MSETEQNSRLLLRNIVVISNLLRRRKNLKMPSSSREVLEVIASTGNATVPHIARVQESSRQNIQVIVNRLQQEGWVQFNINPAHKRSPTLSLTEKAKTALNALESAHKAMLSDLMQGFEPEQVESAIDFLTRLRQRLHTTLSQGDSAELEENEPVTAEPPSTPRSVEELPVNLL